jgi:tRNA threonylcarbamoyl adenosine modification protein YjeE
MAPADPEAGLTLELADEAATSRLGEDLAAVLRPGDLVALSGGLGVGKTSLARALLRALSGDPALEVPSPTFPLRIEHAMPRLNIVHADLYRLNDQPELAELGLEEVLADGAVLVEWPELLPQTMSENRLDVTLAISGAGRIARISGSGSWPGRLARTSDVRAFLERCGWPGAMRWPLVGDASTRAYERIVRGSDTAILMNAPARAEGAPVHGGRSYDAVAHRALDVRPFVAVDRALREAGIRAPKILASDLEAGLLLLEDLGSESILDASGAPILERYEAAIDLLVAMHARDWAEELPLPGGGMYRVPPYDHDALLVEISLFPDWFGRAGSEPAFPPEERDAFLAAWSAVLDRVDGATTLVMRDFHSPNIIWQAQARGPERIGVIDFQDALIGHPAYDVASLAQDARAPLTEADELHLRARYVAGRRAADPGFDLDAFETAYAVFAAQRATKVLGAFTRLAIVEGKPGYQRHRERLKALLRRTLSDPVLSSLRVWYEPHI